MCLALIVGGTSWTSAANRQKQLTPVGSESKTKADHRERGEMLMPPPLSDDTRFFVVRTLRRLDARSSKRGKRTTLTQAEKELDGNEALASLWMRRGLFDGWSGRPQTTAGISPTDSQGINDYHHGYDIGKEMRHVERDRKCNRGGDSTKTL